MQTIYDKNGIDLRDKINYTDFKTICYLSQGKNLLTVFQLNSNLSGKYLRDFFKPIRDKIVKGYQNWLVDHSGFLLDYEDLFEELESNEILQDDDIIQSVNNYIKESEIVTPEEIISRLSDITTMIRPACQKSGVPERYLKRLQGKDCEHLIPEENYFHKFIINNTKHTQFELLYQEQIMGLIKDIFNISFGISDQYRRYLEKNDEIKLKDLKQIFWNYYKDKAPLEDCKTFWKYLLDAGGYLFNKSHAVSYSVNTFETAFIKANAPSIALSTAMNIYSDKSDKIQAYLKEAIHIGIKIKLPKINNCFELTQANHNLSTIFLSCRSIKGIGDNVANKLAKRNDFKSLDDFATFCYNTKGIHKGIVEILIKIDFFSDFTDLSQKEIWNFFDNFYIKTYSNEEKKYIKKYKMNVYKPKKGEKIISEDEFMAVVETSVKSFDMSAWEQTYRRDELNIYFNEIKYLTFPIKTLESIYNLYLEDNEKIIIVQECVNRTGGKDGKFKFTFVKDNEGNSYFYSSKHISIGTGTVLKIKYNEGNRGFQLESFEIIDYLNMEKKKND